MANFDFSIFDEQYPIIIRQMPPVFGSHQFILELAQQNQAMYVRALYEYRNSVHVKLLHHSNLFTVPWLQN